MQPSPFARVVALMLLSATGCIEEQRYHVLGESVLLTADTPPAYVNEDDDPVYRVERAFSLRITPPSERALSVLTSGAANLRLPFPRLPWVALHDLDLQLDYALSNDSERALVVLITLNGSNEFHYYAPGPENFHQWERRVALAPHQRITGTVTEEELDEVAIDLATVVNLAPNSNLVVSAQSQSRLDGRIQPYIPAVIPGLVGVRAGLETTEAVPLTLAITLRVQDHGERAARRGEARWELPLAQPFTLIVPDIE